MRDRFGTPEVRRTALVRRSSPTVEADSSTSWKGHTTRRVRTLQALSSPLSTYVPTIDGTLTLAGCQIGVRHLRR